MKIKELFLNENDFDNMTRDELEKRLELLKKRRDEIDQELQDVIPRGMDLDTGSDPVRVFISPQQKREIDQNPEKYKFGSSELKDPNLIRPHITIDDPKNLMPRGLRDFGDPPPGMHKKWIIPKDDLST